MEYNLVFIYPSKEFLWSSAREWVNGDELITEYCDIVSSKNIHHDTNSVKYLFLGFAWNTNNDKIMYNGNKTVPIASQWFSGEFLI